MFVGAVPIAALLATNRALTGDALTFAYDVLNGPDHRPGFHMSPLGFEHTPMTGLYLVSLYLMRLNESLLGWPVPVVALIAAGMAAWRSVTKWDHLLLAFLCTTLVAYWLYWGDGSFHGPRFLFNVSRSSSCSSSGFRARCANGCGAPCSGPRRCCSSRCACSPPGYCLPARSRLDPGDS